MSERYRINCPNCGDAVYPGEICSSCGQREQTKQRKNLPALSSKGKISKKFLSEDPDASGSWSLAVKRGEDRE